MIRRPPRSTRVRSSAASDVYKRQDREEPAGLFGTGPGVLGGEAAAGDQAVEVGMVHEVLAPGVEDGREAQLGLEALLAELEERGAGALKEQTVERGLVLEDERAQGG